MGAGLFALSVGAGSSSSQCSGPCCFPRPPKRPPPRGMLVEGWTRECVLRVNHLCAPERYVVCVEKDSEIVSIFKNIGMRGGSLVLFRWCLIQIRGESCLLWCLLLPGLLPFSFSRRAPTSFYPGSNTASSEGGSMYSFNDSSIVQGLTESRQCLYVDCTTHFEPDD